MMQLNLNHHFRLGATMYVPATHNDVLAIANREKRTELRSVIFCTEDAVRHDELDAAMRKLKYRLPKFTPQPNLLRFIRVRNPDIMGKLLRTKGIANIDGFVLPKVTPENLHHYTGMLADNDPYLLMPTLETAEATSEHQMRRLLEMLMADRIRHRIASLRIGGNDLLNVYRLRRSVEQTIYSTPVGSYVIPMLVTVFKPFGFNLTAPVFEGLRFPDLLAEELKQDELAGLFGKTAIHPSQVVQIEEAFKVKPGDLVAARLILAPDAPAVFKHDEAMCEPATHRNWAEDILARSMHYGVRAQQSGDAVVSLVVPSQVVRLPGDSVSRVAADSVN